jgi:hypothetical protein
MYVPMNDLENVTMRHRLVLEKVSFSGRRSLLASPAQETLARLDLDKHVIASLRN